ncbi:GlsB/YeaQ/YmgE family stress response membrane protein [Lachnoanaerobaculum sp. Marseille-Q4761]|jgi:transglycosylase associated protein|uniref:GlsB/YeaQ/YmgE family stress response membrane protein n=1 Tax=Lachnoanaerobaculum sp. Marseille-Q4761 TaxID=2819511 RepID=UPI00030795B2
MKPYIKYLQKCLIIKFEDKYINKKEGVKFMIWSIIVGGIIGFIAGEITKKGSAMGIVANVIAGLLGSSVGQALFGKWGPSLAGMSLIPSILGAVIVIAVVSYFLGKKG